METKTKIIGIDAGSESSGIIILVNDRIREGLNLPNYKVIDFIKEEMKPGENVRIVIEDVRPYNMRITDGIIRTIKFLGELEWRLNEFTNFTLIPRWEVKKWIFIQFKLLAVQAIEKKIAAANKRKLSKGESIKQNQPATFVYVDDRIVANAMRKWWNIKNPTRVGERAAYNLKDHSWQALGLVSYYMAVNGIKIKV